MKIWGSITELVKVVFRSGGRETKLDSATQSGSQTDVTFRLPNLVDNSGSPVVATLVEKDLAQVLTNKTIDGDLNTIQDIGVASLKTVLGDANEALVRDASGVVTSAKITNDNVDAAAGIVDTKLATISTAGKVANGATTATNLNTASAIVARDGSNNFSAGTITANITGNVSGTAANVTGIVAKANGGTGADNTNVTFPSTGTLATLAGTETLLNKTTVSSTGLVTGALTLPAGTEAQRPAPTAGMVRYNTDSSAFEGYASGAWSGIGGGGTIDRVTTGSAHGFVVGDLLYLNGATYTKAIATAANTAEVVGMVSRFVSSLIFEITLSGEVSGLTGLTAGDVYFLSAATTGLATNVEPSVIGQVSVPIGVASTTTTMYVAPKRGVVLGGTNARTQLNLASSSPTAIFNAASPSLYTAGELTGWVQLGTSQKFYFRAPFAQNGGSTDWNISPSYVGDTPPAGFSITMANTGVVTMTCPTFTGTGLVNYALNAPAVGATFPLTITSDRILFQTTTPLFFVKANSNIPAWTKTGDFSVSTGQSIAVDNGGLILNIGSSTPVTMVDAATTGRDYYIYLRVDGTLGAYLDTTTAPVGGRLLGGFHYAPGSNAAAEAGGNTTPQINQYSFWDIKWKPSCLDPRGMTLVNNTFWSDIYLTGANAYNASGVSSSKYNVTIADEGSRPFIPAEFGGNGSTRYGNCNWWTATELAASFGKRLPGGQEFQTLAYGTSNEISCGVDPVSTGVNGAGFTNSWEKFTSKWGVIQSTGCMWMWGPEWVLSADVTRAAGWQDLYPAINRGQVFEPANSTTRALLRGANWVVGSNAGVFAVYLGDAPTDTNANIGFRCASNHLIIL